MKRIFIDSFKRFFAPLLIICLPFIWAAVYTRNRLVFILCALATVAAALIYYFGLYKIDFDGESKKQKLVFGLFILALLAFAFVVARQSNYGGWFFKYPFDYPVDDYGCYAQTFDAFQKGRLDIDTDFDLSVLTSLENPYDPYQRYQATGEMLGVYWDRALFDGKLFSYFGVAPIFLVYYPVYFLTGNIPSDFLAALLLASGCCIFLMMTVWELARRIPHKIPFAAVICSAAALPFGSFVFINLSQANFYYIAVLSGVLWVSAFFWSVLRAERQPKGFVRKLLFAFSGGSVGLIAASRPNLLLYVAIALPLLISVIVKKPFGIKSLLGDILAFSLPMLAIGAGLMIYNYLRFGSPFDFGSTYQLTVTDTSTYSFSASLLIPSIYHYFKNTPITDKVFPYLHPNRVLLDYGVSHPVYIDFSVGAMYFPSVWGCVLIPMLYKHPVKFITGIISAVCIFFMAFFDMCFAGVHLRYGTDIMIILMLMGTFLLLYAMGASRKRPMLYRTLFAVSVSLLGATVLVSLPLILDNELDMVLFTHPDFYASLM